MYLDLIEPLLILIGIGATAGFLVCWLVWGLYRTPVAGTWLIVATHVFEATSITPVLNFGISVYLTDITFSIVAAAALLRMVQRKGTITLAHRFWLGFGGALLLSLVLGLVTNGTKAGVEAREMYNNYFTVLYFGSFSFQAARFERLLRVLFAGGAALVILAGMRWTADALDLDQWGPLFYHVPTTTVGESLRVLNSVSTSLLATVLVVLLVWSVQAKVGMLGKCFAAVLAPCVVVLQHRSVWIGTIVALAVLPLRNARVSARLGRNLALAGILGSVVLVPLIAGGYLGNITGALERSVSESVNTRSTFTWRVESWESLLKDWAGGDVRAVLVGRPFGTGFEREMGEGEERAKINVAPHSYYVNMLLRVGVLGTVLLLGTYALVLRWLARPDAAQDREAAATLLLVLIVAQLTFAVVYVPSYLDSILFGTAISMLPKHAISRRSRRAVVGVQWLKTKERVQTS